MHQVVSLKSASALEQLGALGAFEGAVARVNYLVPDQSLQARESQIARRARERAVELMGIGVVLV